MDPIKEVKIKIEQLLKKMDAGDLRPRTFETMATLNKKYYGLIIADLNSKTS